MTTIPINARSAATLAVAATLAACAPGPNPVAGPGRFADDPLPIAAYPQIVPFDGAENILTLQDEPLVNPDPDDGLYTVSAPFRSTVGFTAVMRYRFVYLNDNGREIDRDAWRTISVPAGAAVRLEGSSLRGGIEDWRLDVGRETSRTPFG